MSSLILLPLILALVSPALVTEVRVLATEYVAEVALFPLVLAPGIEPGLSCVGHGFFLDGIANHHSSSYFKSSSFLALSAFPKRVELIPKFFRVRIAPSAFANYSTLITRDILTVFPKARFGRVADLDYGDVTRVDEVIAHSNKPLLVAHHFTASSHI